MSNQPPYRIDSAAPVAVPVGLRRAGWAVSPATQSIENTSPASHGGEISGGRIVRIDRRHPADPSDCPATPADPDAADQDTESHVDASQVDESRCDSSRGDCEPASLHQRWLRLHASDLIDRLQTWSADLDAREAQLNVRDSLQDHRERQFRLLQQDAAAELSEQQRAIDRIRSEINAQARRMAFGG
ncbi:hypothetical protein K227x_13500 [Rubripirellula lacrimiformis]|uniref:Uncharacterized protein n=1 Tax=Rubripirellula lacrimiformis TaxID=1930273 RepID=A0A517N776_9BACT|nr:hypothetical protein [Rubripirellula lacrimiformis]QDT02971.1 hypothetical protein K227x_13500 [Rubripirellula lacrimiformis]